MSTLSNGLSLVRAPLALLFCVDNPTIRLLTIVFAMLTDCIDGYLARRNKTASQFGAVLDPAMDKFFVYFVLSVLYSEKMIGWIPAATMLSRDLFLCLYGFLMIARGRWKTIVFRAIRWGKITTALQFLVLIGLTLGMEFSWIVYGSFIVMGGLAFLELMPLSQDAKAA